LGDKSVLEKMGGVVVSYTGLKDKPRSSICYCLFQKRRLPDSNDGTLLDSGNLHSGSEKLSEKKFLPKCRKGRLVECADPRFTKSGFSGVLLFIF
jgi:hypothetical protein